MDLDVPPAFNPTSHSLRDMLEFPFFDINVEAYLKTVGPTALLARDDCIKKVNECVSDRLIFDKYHPIICSTSRGMGKTAFMEAIGMRIVKPELRNGFIQEAHAYGRVVSFDFASDAAAKAYPTESDIETFFTRLMIYFLCRMFGGTQVEGIHFEVCEFGNVELFAGRQPKFNTWKQHCMQKHADRMMDEYIRLTNAAFGVNCDTPPVFLLDEIQGLCKPTSVQSKLEEDGNIVYHSYLTLLLTQLAGKHKPLCICAGTNSGKIISITERSRIIPHFITLSTPTTQKITACFGVK